MGSKSKGSQQQEPSAQQTAANNALLGYVLGPSVDQFSGSPKTKADNTYGTYFNTLGQPRRRPTPSLAGQPGISGAGNLPGTILPNFEDLLALGGDSFFNSLTSLDADGNPIAGGDGVNPVFSQALNNIFNPSATGFNFNSSSGGNVATPDLGTVIGDPAAQQALDQLLNRPSLFDDVTGGPIVDRIDELTNQQLDAVSSRLASERADALDAANANLAAGGLLSSNQVFRAQEEIIGNSLDDFTLQALDFSRDNIKVLSDLAMRDAQLGTQSAQAVLQGALQEMGINANHAAQIAKINADRAVSIQAAQIQSQTQLALGQQSAGLNLLELGQQDFQSGQQNQLGIASQPLDILTALATGGPTLGSSTSSSGKSL